MNQTTKLKLHQAWNYCDLYDKSTEFMLQFMQDSTWEQALEVGLQEALKLI